MYWMVLAAVVGYPWNDIPNRTLIVDTDIVTKQYIQVQIPDRTYLEIPVVNGWLPAITRATDFDGRPRLIFDFRGRYPASGKFKYVRPEDYPYTPPASPPQQPYAPQTVPVQPVGPPPQPFTNEPLLIAPPARQFMGSWGGEPASLEMKQPSDIP